MVERAKHTRKWGQSYYNIKSFIRVEMTQIEMAPPPIKNKEAAAVQITADQILKDA
jgi:hypothetical protein